MQDGALPALLTRAFLATAMTRDDFIYGRAVLRLMAEFDVDVHKDTLEAVPLKIAEWRRAQIRLERGVGDVTKEMKTKVFEFKEFNVEWESLIEQRSKMRR